jgi:uncharacterized protein
VLVYLDSCIVIYVVEGREPWSSLVAAQVAARATARFVVSDLVRMECLVGAIRLADDALVSAFETYLAGCEHAPITSGTFDRAAHLRADHGLKTPDALHLAAALEARCAELWTNDDRFGRVHAGIVIRRVV